MESLLHLDLPTIIKTIGVFGLTLVIFTESGLIIGIFFPGDSLLFTAGLLASQGVFPIDILIFFTFIAALGGNVCGYAIGKRFGLRLFQRPDSRFFKKEYVARTEEFFRQHGGKTVILSRFLPVVRTLTPPLAGIGAMPYRSFIIQSSVGAALWGVALPLLGYGAGTLVPDVDRYLLPIIVTIIVISFIPTIIHWKLSQQKSES